MRRRLEADRLQRTANDAGGDRIDDGGGGKRRTALAASFLFSSNDMAAFL